MAPKTVGTGGEDAAWPVGNRPPFDAMRTRFPTARAEEALDTPLAERPLESE